MEGGELQSVLELGCGGVAGYWEEEHSYSRRSWEAYQREILHQLGNHNNNNEEEDEDRDSD